MSSSDYRLNLIWSSHGDQLRADIERNIGSLVGYDRTVQQSNRNMGLWGQQMKAIGTTIRYALAGLTVYGVAGAVQGLGQYLDRLGQIDSLAGQINSSGNFQGLGRQLNDVGDIAIQLSDKWGVAVDDIQQHMIRFYSSFGDEVRGQKGLNLLRSFTAEMQNLSMIAEGADPQQLGGGIASLVIGQTKPGQAPDPRNFGRMTDIIARVMQQTPTLTGANIANDVGRLAAASQSARMTPEQVFGVYGLAARAGGSGMVIGRGVTQLLGTSLTNPKSKAAQHAFRMAGLPTDPNALYQLGGLEILKRMMTAVAPNGASFSNRRALGDEAIVDDQSAIDAAGARGINMTLGTQLFGRQESFRQFLNLMANGGVPALDNFIKGINDAEKHRLGAQMAEDRNRLRTYQQFAQTQRNVGLTLARGLDPIMRPLAGAGANAGDWVNRQNPAAVAGAVGGAGAAAIASRLIFGASLTGLAGKGIARIPGVGPLLAKMGLGKLAGRAPALSAAALVGSGLGAFNATGVGTERAGSRSNPYWVVIDPLSWFMPGAPNADSMGGGSGPGGTKVPPVVPLWARRLGIRGALRAGGAGAALLATPAIAQAVQDHLTNKAIDEHAARTVPGGHPLLAALGRNNRATGFSFSHQPNAQQQKILDAFIGRRINADVAEKRLAALTQHGIVRAYGKGAGTGFGFGEMLTGEAGVTIQFEATPELAAALRDINRKTHVPVKLWPKTGQKQTFRGKQKTQRGSGGRSNK